MKRQNGTPPAPKPRGSVFSITHDLLPHLLLTGLLVTLVAAPAAIAAAEDEHVHGAHASHDGPQRPDAHAPIGVMQDHTHAKGEVMGSYRYMRMDMDVNQVGTDEVAPNLIVRPLGPYGVTPTKMTMDMHMLGLMWAPSDRVTIAGMFPFVSLSMDHLNMAGRTFTTSATGIGDIGAAVLVDLVETARSQLHLNLGMTFPSGSIDRTDTVPGPTAPLNPILPYPMQLGSGTWDLRPGLTYNGQAEHVSWGAQGLGTLRLGTNDANYRLGHAYQLTGWGAWKATRWLSAAGRAEWRQWFDIVGADARLVSPMPAVFPAAMQFIPTADPNLRAGRRLDIGPSINLVMPEGPLAGIRLGAEALFPVYQSLDGPQLATDWILIVGTQYVF